MKKRQLDAGTIKNEFPLLLHYSKNNIPFSYLDNSASTQKPEVVINFLENFYSTKNANVHRGLYDLSQEATRLYENARTTAANFINADSADEIVFVRGATEGINFIASTYGRNFLKAGDEILVSELEHHSNFVPWVMLAKEVNATVKAIPIDSDGNLDLSNIDELLNERTKIVAVTHTSNVLGTITPIEKLTKLAHKNGAVMVVDAAQALAHSTVDVQKLNCDFLVCSGHKMYAPLGIGFLYGKKSILEQMAPYHGGSNMLERASLTNISFAPIPQRFEAGTPNIAGAIALAKTIDYLESFEKSSIFKHEKEVITYAETLLRKLNNVEILANPKERAGALSFLVKNIHPHDLATILGNDGIAVRAGNHCCQPLMEALNLRTGTVRASFALYNTKEDCDRLFEGLKKVFRIFGIS